MTAADDGISLLPLPLPLQVGRRLLTSLQ